MLLSHARNTILFWLPLHCSRHLLGQAPEEDGLGVRFIWQDSFSIDQLPWLWRTDCCRVWMYCLCLEDLVAWTSICRNCRHDRTPQNTRALPVDEVQPGNFRFAPGIDDYIMCLQQQVTREMSIESFFGLVCCLTFQIFIWVCQTLRILSTKPGET